MGQRKGFSPKDIAKINAMYCKRQNGFARPPANNRPGNRPPNVSSSPFYPNPDYYPDYYPSHYPEYPIYGAPYPPPNYPNYGPPGFYPGYGPGFYPPRPFPKNEIVDSQEV